MLQEESITRYQKCSYSIDRGVVTRTYLNHIVYVSVICGKQDFSRWPLPISFSN